MLPLHALRSLSRFWVESTLDSLQTSRLLLRGQASGQELRALRARCLSRMSELADDQMRSGEFLELLTFTLHSLSAPQPWRVPPNPFAARSLRSVFMTPHAGDPWSLLRKAGRPR